MNSPIKPPGAGDPAAGTQSIDVSETSQAESAESAHASNPESVESVLADLRAGRLNVETAVDQIIESTLQRNVEVTADPTARAQLAEEIRRAVADDPNLRDLVDDLEQDFPT
jgi:hypothetical protein